MDRNKKIRLLWELEYQHVIRELPPVPTADHRGTAYWHYAVLRPDHLPEQLRAEYKKLGELRW